MSFFVAVSMIFFILIYKFVFGCFQTSLLFRVGELEGRGSVAVAVGVSNR